MKGFRLVGSLILALVGAMDAGAIEKFTARDLSNDVYKAREVRPDSRPSPELGARAGDPAALLGPWKTNVGGGVWQTPSAIPGWDTLHISAGALSGLLVIYPDHTYVWNAYGGKKGRWAESGDPSYPVKLEDLKENRIWQVGLDARHPGRIFVRDTKGYYYYQGTRAK